MRVSGGRIIRRATAAVAIVLLFNMAATVADAKGKLFKKEWVITVTAPDSPTGNQFGVKTFIIRARKSNAPPSPLPLRKLTATAEDGTRVQGVWRQEGKDFSLTFELACPEGVACATVTLRGRFPSNTVTSGQAIIMWDTRDRDNVAGFETVNGTFEGFQQ